MSTRPYLTTEDIAEQLHISVYTVRRYIRSGKLKAVKLEGAYRVRREDFEQFLREREIGQSQRPAEPEQLAQRLPRAEALG